MIVDAIMIVGVLFAEAFGRTLGVKDEQSIARYMFIWGIVAILPFTTSAILAVFNYEISSITTIVGFIGFTAWFLFISAASHEEKKKPNRKIVAVNELQKYLSEEFRVVAVLGGGFVVIEK